MASAALARQLGHGDADNWRANPVPPK